MRSLYLVLPLALSVTACSLFAPHPATSTWTAPTAGGGGPACAGMIEQLKAGYCQPLDPEGQIRQPDRDAAEREQQVNTLVAQSREGLRQQCPAANLDAEFAEMDRCLEKNRVAAKVEQEEQAVRLPRERRKVPRIKRDPRYRSALSRYRDAGEQERLANEDLEDAKTRQGLDCGRRSADCDRLGTLRGRVSRAVAKRKEAEAQLKSVIESHGVDRRDGQELGLW